MAVVAPHVRAGALRGGPGSAAGSTPSTSSSTTSPTAIAEVPELRRAARRTRSSTRARRRGALGDVSGDADELVRNFSCSSREKGRAGELEEIAASSTRSSRRAAGHAQRRADDRVRALRRGGAASILEQIEQASGRTVEATRQVDPDLIGGIVLQAGSLRVDASVRGRLDGLYATNSSRGGDGARGPSRQPLESRLCRTTLVLTHEAPVGARPSAPADLSLLERARHHRLARAPRHRSDSHHDALRRAPLGSGRPPQPVRQQNRAERRYVLEIAWNSRCGS